MKLAIDAHLLSKEKIKIDKEFLKKTRAEEGENFPFSVLPAKFAEQDGYKIPKALIKEEKAEKDETKPPPFLAELRVTEKYMQHSRNLHKFINNPVLPTDLISMLRLFEKELTKSIIGIISNLNDFITNFDSVIASLDDLATIDTSYIHNRLNGELNNIEKPLEDIRSFIRAYYDPDKVVVK